MKSIGSCTFYSITITKAIMIIAMVTAMTSTITVSNTTTAIATSVTNTTITTANTTNITTRDAAVTIKIIINIAAGNADNIIVTIVIVMMLVPAPAQYYYWWTLRTILLPNGTEQIIYSTIILESCLSKYTLSGSEGSRIISHAPLILGRRNFNCAVQLIVFVHRHNLII